MNDPVYQELLEISLRRPLNPAEEARLRELLARQPGGEGAWAQEQALNRLLTRLPNAPVSTNFTARVLQAVELEQRAARRSVVINPWLRWLSLRWTHQTALAALVLGAGLFSYHQYQLAGTASLAREVAAVTRVVALAPSDVSTAPARTNFELLRDYDAIRRFNTVSGTADSGLLAMMTGE